MMEAVPLQNNTATTELDPSGGGQNYMVVTSALTFSVFALTYYLQQKGRGGKGKFKVIPEVPYFKFLMSTLKNGKDLPRILQSLTEKYGDVVKFPLFVPWFPCVIVNNAAMIQKLVTSKDHLGKDKMLYKTAAGFGPMKDGLAFSDMEIWKEHRPPLLKAFTMGALKSYMPICVEHATQLAVDIQSALGANKIGVVDSGRLLRVHGLRVISDLTLGKLPDTKEQHEANIQYIKDILTFKLTVADLLFKPHLLYLKPLWWVHPNKRVLDKSIDGINKYFNQIIKNYRTFTKVKQITEQEKKAQQGQFNLDYNDPSNQVDTGETETARKSTIEMMIESGFTDEEILSETWTIFIAAHDTPPNALHFFLYYMAIHPEHQVKCREEVDEWFEKTDLKNMSIQDAHDLKYTERCIKEAMRIVPPVTTYARSSKVPLKLSDDIQIEPNTAIFISPWALHRKPEYYPDPEKFDPDRFLPENSEKRSRYAYMPFSAGPRDCLGWKFALIEMNIFAAYVLRHYEVDFLRDGMENMKIEFRYSMDTDPAIRFTFNKRNHVIPKF